jgi:hypothetical protein
MRVFEVLRLRLVRIAALHGVVGVAHVPVDAALPDPRILQEGFERVSAFVQLQVRRREAGVGVRLQCPAPVARVGERERVGAAEDQPRRSADAEQRR